MAVTAAVFAFLLRREAGTQNKTAELKHGDR